MNFNERETYGPVHRPDWLSDARVWSDNSWHNDAMPHCTLYLVPDGVPQAVVEVWVNYEKPEDREVPPRYEVVFQRDWQAESSEDVTLYMGDDEAEARAWARSAERAKEVLADAPPGDVQVFNATDQVYAHPDAFKREEVGRFLIEFLTRFERQGFYASAAGRIPVSELKLKLEPADAELDYPEFMRVVEAVAGSLRNRGLVLEIQYPGYLDIGHPTRPAVRFHAGIANGPWELQTMTGLDASECTASSTSTIPGGSTDAAAIAAWIEAEYRRAAV
jgi:hypothetical protein